MMKKEFRFNGFRFLFSGCDNKTTIDESVIVKNTERS